MFPTYCFLCQMWFFFCNSCLLACLPCTVRVERLGITYMHALSMIRF